jgi:hypothetical protein
MGSLRTALAGVVGRFASDRPNGKERFHKTRHLIRQLRVSLDYADYGQATLLRASCCRCAAEQRDELATLHSITSSARASSVAGIEAARI